MIPELGFFCLLLALSFSLLLSIFPVLGVVRQNSWMRDSSSALVAPLFVAILIAFLILSYSFLNNDFSVSYIANNSNSLLPWYFKLSAVWGGHEGSMLLWVLVLVSWTLAVAIFSRHLDINFRAVAMSTLGALNFGFLLFIVFTSNPFQRILPFPPLEGADLNPLLQDIGLIIHPPMLYMGYVGFSVPFAFAIAALVCGKLDTDLARWLRPWSNVAWAFLTVGIALGSWWAYYELGWGGWWFWDPVENASFMPWLVGTALVHSLAVAEKRNLFKRWTLMLALSAFSLSLLGTFLVRSGVLTSVHSFASDPERGLFILMFLFAVIGGSLFLYGWRLFDMESSGGFEAPSREAALLLNNLLLVVTCSMVLLGTLFPLVFEFLGLGSISIGAPYFDRFFALFMAPALLLLPIGQWMRWKRHKAALIAADLKSALLVALGVALLVIFALSGWRSVAIISAALFSSWILTVCAFDLWRKIETNSTIKQSVRSMGRLPLSYWGMQTAHIGVAIAVVGILCTTSMSVNRDVRMAVGDSYDVGGYVFQMESLSQVQGPNYIAQQATFDVFKNNALVATTVAQKRRYLARGDLMTEAGISGNIFRDLYVSMGEPLDDGAWAIRLYVKPFIRWIWGGAFLMAFGAVLAIFDRRYRQVKRRSNDSVVGAES